MDSSTLLNNRYRLLEPIGSGGMAEVWSAHDLLLDRTVAVKILREEYSRDDAFQDRFLREAQTLAKLPHPNLIAVYDYGVQDGRCFMILEKVDGTDLKTVIKQSYAWRSRQPLTLPEWLDIAIQICEGLGIAHRAGLVHCDMKPQNVLLDANRQVKIADFGIARAAASPSLEGTGKDAVVWGSPAYLSPEQAAGEPLTPASDVYSTGVMLFEMLTGRLPFPGKNPEALALQHLEAKPPSPRRWNSEIPEEIEEVILRAMAKDPAGRFRNGEQMARVLCAIEADSEAEILEPDPGIDWLAIALSFMAVLSVGGLIPLWVYVYLLYNPPAH